MSSESVPISSERFAFAIQDLPIENIYSKAHEIENSIAHLQRSNEQLQEYSDSIKNDTSLDVSVRQDGDKDCLEAIRDNNVVIQRQLERVGLLKQEVERRGARWHGGDETEAATNGYPDGPNGSEAPPLNPRSNGARGGTMTDEELRRRLEEQIGADADGDDDEEGMHL